MISLIRETVLANNWLTENDFMAFIAVSESTPGPLAVNMATFIGTSLRGIAGALLATLGVVLPAFMIMLFIASRAKNLLKYTVVKSFLTSVRPCIAALILATSITMGLKIFGKIEQITDSFKPNYEKIIIFLALPCIGVFLKKVRQKPLSPILMIIISACLGIVFNLI